MAQHKPKLVVRGDVLSITGQIQFETVMSLYQNGQRLIALMQQIIVDLRELEHCDSSGLALFTAWMREAELQNKTVYFTNIPLFMQDLIRVYGLDSVLPIKMVV